jgi:ribonuclease HI
MGGVLTLHTDASIHGRRLGKGRRARVGPGFAAWRGWHDCQLPDCPSFTGQAYIGPGKGTQRAEYQAVIHGLSAAHTYVVTRPPAHRPERISLRIDNKPVYMLLTEQWKPNELVRYHRAATELRDALLALGLTFAVAKVPESDPAQKIVHQMSKQAMNQVLVKQDWRPKD